MNELKITYITNNDINVELRATEDWDQYGRINTALPYLFAKVIKDLGANPVAVVEELKEEFDYEFFQKEQEDGKNN